MHKIGKRKTSNQVRLNENQFNSLVKRLVKESVRRILNEVEEDPYLEDPSDPAYWAFDDEYRPGMTSKDVEVNHSWKKFNKKPVAGSDWYGSRDVSVDDVPDTVDSALSNRYKKNYFSDFENNAGDSIMDDWVNGDIEDDDIGPYTKRMMDLGK